MTRYMLIPTFLVVAQDAAGQFIEQCPPWSTENDECPYLYEYEGCNIYIARTVEAAHQTDPKSTESHFANFIFHTT